MSPEPLPSSAPRVALRKRRGALALLVLSALFVVALLDVAMRLVIARPPPTEVVVSPPLGAPLTEHVTLVIVDGLRYEIAVDEALMPNMARRMREHSSGEIWASPVSMTSSAILTYATGQRGDIDQIVNNESGTPVLYDSLMDNAHAAGLTTAYTGDRAWIKMFPNAWDASHPDPKGVGIEIDYNAEIFEAAYAFVAAPKRANFSVYHFVTPDHQAHAYGVLSERYRDHIHAFDGLLDGLLRAIPSDTTVFVTSDHGATDTGTHGSDTPIQRRSPIFAMGPGIAVGRHDPRPLDQIDLPATFAALLGVSAPAQSRGHLLVDWLDVPDAERARLACVDLSRLIAYGRASHVDDATIGEAERACEGGSSPRVAIDRAASVAVRMDQALGRADGGSSRLGLLVPVLAILGALGLSLAALGGFRKVGAARFATSAALFLFLLAAATALTYGVELLPGTWPDPIRIALYTSLNGVLLYAIVKPRQAMGWLDRNLALGVVVFPGVLLVSHTRATQPEAYSLSVVLALFAMTVGLRTLAAPRESAAPKGLLSTRKRLLLVLLLLAALAPVGTMEAGFLPKALTSDTTLLFAAAALSMVLFAIERHTRDAKASVAATLVTLGTAVASLWFRRSAPAWLCVAAWILLLALALLAFARGRRSAAELMALGSYAWVSRDAEIPILLASYVVASSVGDALGADLERAEKPSLIRPSTALTIIVFVFSFTFVQRIGVQLGLDFVHFDWGAGAFREADVSLVRIGVALTYKHALARASLLFAVLVALPRTYRDVVARGLFVVELARTAALVTLLYYCRHSFWTSMRLIGDLPHALSAVVVAALAVSIVSRGQLAEAAYSFATSPQQRKPTS